MSELRRLMNIVESAQADQPLDEKYSSDNAHMLHYMRGGEDGDTMDPYAVWYGICDWLEKHDYLDEVSELINQRHPEGEPIHLEDAHELNEHDPEIFYLLPKDVQQQAYEAAVEFEMRHNPADAPTTAHMDLRRQTLLPRDTWLVHFSDEAWNIAENGFKYGVDRMDQLGLTTWFRDEAKKNGGYNFAFLADSRDARYAAGEKYGKHAVMFQNSGVHCYHYGDEENQVVFWGADVDPRDIILLTQEGGDWSVNAKNPRAKRDVLFVGSFEAAVQWVGKNYNQYRGLLSGR